MKTAPVNEVAAAEESRLPDRKDLAVMAGLFLCALLIRLYFLPFFKVISADGVGYVNAARAVARGGNLDSLTIYGAVYPPLVAAAGFLTGDMELAGRLVSAFMGSLLVVPVYLIAKEFFSKREGVLAGILILAWPSLRMWSCEVMTQATYITLMLGGVYAMWLSAGKGSRAFGFGAGMLMGFAYLTRPEALVTFVALAAVLLAASPVLAGSWKKGVTLTLVTAAGFIIPLIPFVFLVHGATGKWQLAGKTASTLADALSEYLGRPDLKNDPTFHGIGILDVVRTYPDFLWMNFLKNLRATFQTMVPWYLWAMALLGFATYGWSRERMARQAALLATFAPLLVIVVFFFVGPEYLQPYLPVLFLWGASGFLKTAGWLGSRMNLEKWEFLRGERAVFPLAVFAVLCFSGSLLADQIPKNADEPYHYSQDGGRYDQKRIGLLLKKELPAGSKIMTRWGRISFYAEMEQVMIPQAGYQELFEAARSSKTKYIIVDGMLAGMRPQFELLYRPLFGEPETLEYRAGAGPLYMPFPNIRLIYLHKEPSSIGVAVYEVLS